MGRRLKKITFTDLSLCSEGLTLAKLTSLFDQLPPGAIIRGFGRNVASLDQYVFIEAPSFPELKEGEAIPDIYVQSTHPSQSLAPRKASGMSQGCKCDYLYLGYSKHQKGCPRA